MKLAFFDLNSCGVNYQTQYIYQSLYSHFEYTKDLHDADIIVMLGGCCCTEDAFQYTLRCIDYVLESKKSTATTLLCGCITRGLKNSSELEGVNNFIHNNIDYVFDHYNYNELIKKVLDYKNITPTLDDNYGMTLVDKDFADLFIQNGCTHNCTFCKANYLNCRLIDAPLNEIKEQIDSLDEDNVNIVQLRGLNLSQYGLDLYHEYKLMEVCEYIENKKNIETVILSNFAFQDAIKAKFAERLKYLEKTSIITGSLESGSNRLLKLMNKGFTKEEFLEFYYKINTLYRKTYRLNIISGFPTETTQECLETLELLKLINPSLVHINTYLDSKYIPSHNLEQLPYPEIRNHTRIYKRILKNNKIPYIINSAN